MYRKITDHKWTASIGRDLRVRVMGDDGWEEILDHHFDVASEQEGHDRLIAMGFEEYDPNADLKAKGMVFLNGCYRMPAQVEADRAYDQRMAERLHYGPAESSYDPIMSDF